MAQLKLNKSEIINFINSYREYECLWNYKSENYKITDLKRKAWEEIGYKFKCTADEGKKKIKYLRAAYVAEKKKVEDSKRSGSSGDVYEPNLFYFNEFSYLDGAIVLRKRYSNFDENNSSSVCFSQEDATTDPIESIPCKLQEITNVEKEILTDDMGGFSQKNRNKRKRIEDPEDSTQKFDKAIDAIVNFAVRNPSPKPEPDDMFAAFAKSVAVQLKNLAPVRASTAMAEIQEIISKHTICELKQTSSQRIEIVRDEVIVPSPYCATQSHSEDICFSPEFTSSFHSSTNESRRTAMHSANIYEDENLFEEVYEY